MIYLHEFGYIETEITPSNGLIPARIIEIHRNLYKSICEYGEVLAILKGSFLHKTANKEDFPAVGDFVMLQYNAEGNSSIAEVLPRKSKFSRTDFSGHAVGYVKTIREQVVAANFDYVFIMSSLNQDFSVNRILRYVTAAKQSGGIPVVILTKADLCENYDAQINEIREMAGDIQITAVSSFTGIGLDTVSKYLQPAKTIVFLGMSGVGKSSLVNALVGRDIMSVKEIRDDDSRGRHTTTHRQMIKLPSGALIIDTPGMRELGLWDADEGIKTAFSDIEDLFSQCRFSDCSHTKEAGCAVRTALADGSLLQKQWSNYLAQKREATFVEHKKKRKDGHPKRK